MRLKHVDDLSGKGEIYEGATLIERCAYRLRRYDLIIDVPLVGGRAQELNNGCEIKGTITPDVLGSATGTLWMIEKIGLPLVLHLTDVPGNLRLDFIFSDMSGSIESNSAIYEGES